MIGSGVMPFGHRRTPNTADSLAAARLLAERGPLFAEKAVEILGWTSVRWWDAVSRRKEWFSLAGSGWELTEAGRRVLQEFGGQ